MTNIVHFRAASQLLKDKSELNTVLWVVPPTRMDEKQLRAEGIYETLERLTDRTEAVSYTHLTLPTILLV